MAISTLSIHNYFGDQASLTCYEDISFKFPKRVLLVEDEPINLKVTQTMLEGLGYIVVAAMTGKEAIQKYNHTFYAIVLDIGLPDMEGFEVCKHIRAQETMGEHIPIIACTAYDLDSVYRECLAAGMDAITNKPISQSALGKIIEQCRAKSINQSNSPAK